MCGPILVNTVLLCVKYREHIFLSVCRCRYVCVLHTEDTHTRTHVCVECVSLQVCVCLAYGRHTQKKMCVHTVSSIRKTHTEEHMCVSMQVCVCLLCVCRRCVLPYGRHTLCDTTHTVCVLQRVENVFTVRRGCAFSLLTYAACSHRPTHTRQSI